MDIGLADSRAFVLAASSGIGKAVATELAREGARVVIAARDEARLSEAVEEIREETGCGADAADYVVCDLDDPESVETGTTEAIEKLGGLDVLVTNHGGPSTAPFEDLTMADIDDGYQGILRSTVQACEIALPALRDGGGAITHLVAVSALEPGPRSALCNVFRPAIYGLSKTLAESYGDDGVRSNCVGPKGIASDRIEEKLSERADREGISRDEALDQRLADLPVDELGDPETFGKVAAFVSSPAADYVTGSHVPVDGGWHRHAF